MSRLSHLWLVVALLAMSAAVTTPVAAQLYSGGRGTSSSPTAAAPNYFGLMGHVNDPKTYELATPAPLLRDFIWLVGKGPSKTASGQVRILRQGRILQEYLSPESRTVLQSGDLVILDGQPEQGRIFKGRSVSGQSGPIRLAVFGVRPYPVITEVAASQATVRWLTQQLGQQEAAALTARAIISRSTQSVTPDLPLSDCSVIVFDPQAIDPRYLPNLPTPTQIGPATGSPAPTQSQLPGTVPVQPQSSGPVVMTPHAANNSATVGPYGQSPTPGVSRPVDPRSSLQGNLAQRYFPGIAPSGTSNGANRIPQPNEPQRLNAPDAVAQPILRHDRQSLPESQPVPVAPANSIPSTALNDTSSPVNTDPDRPSNEAPSVSSVSNRPSLNSDLVPQHTTRDTEAATVRQDSAQPQLAAPTDNNPAAGGTNSSAAVLPEVSASILSPTPDPNLPGRLPSASVSRPDSPVSAEATASRVAVPSESDSPRVPVPVATDNSTGPLLAGNAEIIPAEETSWDAQQLMVAGLGGIAFIAAIIMLLSTVRHPATPVTQKTEQHSERYWLDRIINNDLPIEEEKVVLPHGEKLFGQTQPPRRTTQRVDAGHQSGTRSRPHFLPRQTVVATRKQQRESEHGLSASVINPVVSPASMPRPVGDAEADRQPTAGMNATDTEERSRDDHPVTTMSPAASSLSSSDQSRQVTAQLVSSVATQSKPASIRGTLEDTRADSDLTIKKPLNRRVDEAHPTTTPESKRDVVVRPARSVTEGADLLDRILSQVDKARS